MPAPPAIGIIGGSGWLGRAIAESLLATGFVPPSSLTLSCRSLHKVAGDLPGVRWTADNQAVVDGSALVLLCVRPEQFRDVAIDAGGRTLVSVMAGVPLNVLAARTGTDRIVRAMPNAAARIRQSYTPWFASEAVPADAREQVQALFGCCGVAEQVPSEDQLDYLSGLAGTGPAFPALLADAMIRAAVERGIAPDTAHRAAIGVVAGAAQLLRDTEPADMIQALAEYRGVTAAALEAMRDGGFSELVRRGLAAAEARAAEMAADFRPESRSNPLQMEPGRATDGTTP